MKLSVSYPLAPCRASSNTVVVRDHFGVSPNPEPHVVASDFELPLNGDAGRIVLFVGPSGSGKSSLLRAAAGQLERVLDIDTLDLGSRSLVDEIPWRVDEGLRLLALCGLGEARLLLRTVSELSEGQRYRFRLARGVAERPAWVLADEFTATLDRTLAKVVAFGVRRVADREGVGFLLATTHEDVVADLAPDVVVRCEEGHEPRVELARTNTGQEPEGRKKKESCRSRTSSPSRPARNAIGRILLGGITGDGTSV
jgi:uncharacterized protein